MAAPAIWYVEPVNGDDLNTGTNPADAFETMDAALDAANADGGAGQTIYVIANSVVTPAAQSAQKFVTVVDLSIIGMDANGVAADDLANFDWGQPPVWSPTLSVGLDAVVHSAANSTLTIRGFIALGTFGGRYWLADSSATAVIDVYDCTVGGFFTGGMATTSPSAATRCWFDDMPRGIASTGNGVIATSCLFTELTDTAFWKASSGTIASVVHSLFYHCDGVGNYPCRFADTTANWTIQNCLFVDNPTAYGCHGGSYISNSCYTSDGGTYHTTANWSGTPDADDYELDPLFRDAANEDWHLLGTSPVIGLQGEPVDPDWLTQDRQPMPNVLGPLGVLGEILWSVVRGQNLVQMKASIEWTRAQLQWTSWDVAGPFDAPRVASVTANADDATIIDIRTDMTLREDVDYTFTAAPFGNAAAAPQVLTGKRLSVYERPSDTLIDLGLEPFEDFDYTAGGDIPLTGGIRTVRKMVLDALMTPLGALPWSPGYGTDLQHKRPRPLDLDAEARRRKRQVEAIPGVRSADVTLTWSENYHMIVAIRVETDFGPLSERLNLTRREVIV
jgi:hypothetical protein